MKPQAKNVGATLPPCAVRLTNHASRLSNHLIRPRQHVRRYRQADLFRGLQVDDEFKFRRLLDRKIRWLRPFEYLVHVDRGAPETLSIAG